jgi:hypothetical protein
MRRTKALIIAAALMAIPLSARPEEFKLSVGTNTMEYLNLLTPNLDIGVGFDRHWSMHLQGKYNPFFWQAGGETFQNRQLTASAGFRYWPWFLHSGWYIGSSLQYSQYNRGGILSPLTEEGDAYGIALRGGYSLMINKWMNIEFGAGIWGGKTRFKTYQSPRCGKLLESSEKLFILPDGINISLVFTL